MKLRNLFCAGCVDRRCRGASPGAGDRDTVSAGPLTLTLEQALEIALSESPTVKIADQTVEVEEACQTGTYAGLWPEMQHRPHTTATSKHDDAHPWTRR